MGKRGRPPLQESPTRDFLLQAAKNLFSQKGFHSVSVEEICRHAGASKMSFYRHFKDKTHIALIRMQAFIAEEQSWAEALLASDRLFPEKMNLIYIKRFEHAKKVGDQFLLDFFALLDPGVISFKRKLEKETTKLNLQFLSQGQKVGLISQKVKPKIFLFFIQKRNELLMDKELEKLCPNREEKFTIVNDFFYFGLSKHSSHLKPKEERNLCES